MAGDRPRETGPLVIEIEDAALPKAPSPAEAPPPDADEADVESAPRIADRGPAAGSGLLRWLLAAAGALFMLWLGVAINDFIAGLFARMPLLGWVGVALVLVLSLGLLALIVREFAGLARLARMGTLRARAEDAVATGAPGAAGEVIAGLDRLYRGRTDLDWARERLAGALGDTPDPQARLEIAERLCLSPLDEAAEAAIMRASRTVAATTALLPLAAVDVLAAFYCNLRMVREIAEIYGGRAGWLGSWRLTRAVIAHLVATGAVAATDDMLGPLIGGGVLGQLSRRFGEGAVNGALTARVGVAAIDVSRPLPYISRARPSASGLLLKALRSWRSEDRPAEKSER